MHRIVAGRGEDLDGDMISAGVKVGVEGSGERVGRAVQREGVGQTVGSAAGDVVVGLVKAA